MFVRCQCFSPLNQQRPRHYTSQSPSFLAHLFPPKVATPMPCDGDLCLIPSPNVIQSSAVAPWHRFAQDHQVPKEFGMSFPNPSWWNRPMFQQTNIYGKLVLFRTANSSCSIVQIWRKKTSWAVPCGMFDLMTLNKFLETCWRETA